MGKTKKITLSEYVRPQVRLDESILTPMNMTVAPDRLAYLQGLVRNVTMQQAVWGKPESDPEHAWLTYYLKKTPFAEDFLRFEVEGARLRVTLKEAAETEVSFDAERLRVYFLDGRARNLADTVWIPSGKQTPRLAALISELMRGMEEATLKAGLVALKGGAELWRKFQKRGWIVPVADGAGRTEPSASGDRLSWLGHAFAVLQSGKGTVWVDPLVFPKIRWTDEDRATCFSNDFAEARWMPERPEDVQPRVYRELPEPDVVLITHQDRDHFDLGSLMMLPSRTVIVVPDCEPDRPWEVDLRATLRQVLGPRRKVVRLKHGQTLRVGRDITVRALPFVGEMPASMPHRWNCYLVQMRTSAVLFTADATATDAVIAQAAKWVGRGRTLSVFSGPPSDFGSVPGYQEGGSPYVLSRLWPWYLRPVDRFNAVAADPITSQQLSYLAKKARLEYHFTYASGGAPWFRIQDPQDAFFTPLFGLSRQNWARIEARVTKAGVRTFPGKYGEPVILGRRD